MTLVENDISGTTLTTPMVGERMSYGLVLSSSLLSLFATVGVELASEDWPTGLEAQQVVVTMPITNIGAASQVFQVNVVFASETWTARTALGRRLLELREQAISKGMKLLTQDEVLDEIRRRRGEPLENV